MDHVVPSLGYNLWRSRRRLAPAFGGLPPAELISCASRGWTPRRRWRTCGSTNGGDTGPGIFEREPRVFRSRAFMLERTFLGEEHGQGEALQRSPSGGHRPLGG